MTTQEATRQIVQDVMERALRVAAQRMLESVAALPAEGDDVQAYRRQVLATLRSYEPPAEPPSSR